MGEEKDLLSRENRDYERMIDKRQAKKQMGGEASLVWIREHCLDQKKRESWVEKKGRHFLGEGKLPGEGGKRPNALRKKKKRTVAFSLWNEFFSFFNNC